MHPPHNISGPMPFCSLGTPSHESNLLPDVNMFQQILEGGPKWGWGPKIAPGRIIYQSKANDLSSPYLLQIFMWDPPRGRGTPRNSPQNGPFSRFFAFFDQKRCDFALKRVHGS